MDFERRWYLVALAFVAYLPVFYGGYVFDDQRVLSVVAEPDSDLWKFQPTRFLANLSLAVSHALGGGHAWAHHLLQIMIHALACAAVWVLTNTLVLARELSPEGKGLGFWAALLFALHPVNTESVSYIAQTSSALVTVFYLWSCVFYIIFRRSSPGRLRGASLAMTLGFAGLALLSKETAVTLPLAWMLLDVVVLRTPVRWWAWLGLGVALVATMGMLFGWQWHWPVQLPLHSQSHRGDFLTAGTYAMTQLRVCMVFLRLLVVPVGLNVDYDFPMSHSLAEPATLGSLVAVLVLIVMAVRVRHRHWALALWVSMFFVSIASHLFFPRANVISEHKLYLAAALMVPAAVIAIYLQIGQRLAMVVIPILVLFAFLTVQRNWLWGHPVRLWEETARQSPQKARVHMNLGVAYFQTGLLDKSLEAYQKALKLAPEMVPLYTNISDVYKRKGEFAEAMDYADQALRLDSQFAVGYQQKGILYAVLNQDQLALQNFNRALELNPKLPGLKRMRQILRERMGSKGF